MRIIKAKDGQSKRITAESVKTFFKKNGKKVVAVSSGIIIIGVAVGLNAASPKKTEQTSPASSSAVEQKQSEDFFASSSLSRTKARDEAIEVLHTVVDLGKDEEAAKQALEDISRISSDIEREANVETMIKAKGFDDCIAVISGDTLNIVIKAKELLPNEIAQIKEIAYKGASVLPDNVIITLKG